jgi:hypothetical protein
VIRFSFLEKRISKDRQQAERWHVVPRCDPGIATTAATIATLLLSIDDGVN